MFEMGQVVVGLMQKEQRVPQPNFQYGKSIFDRMGSSKKAAPKNPNMIYEQLLSSVFSCFHGQTFKLGDEY